MSEPESEHSDDPISEPEIQPPASNDPPPVTPQLAKKTPLRHRQDMQSWITLGAGALLAIVILGVLVRWLITPTADVSSFAGAVIAPLIGLVGPVIGYFFGRTRE